MNEYTLREDDVRRLLAYIPPRLLVKESTKVLVELQKQGLDYYVSEMTYRIPSGAGEREICLEAGKPSSGALRARMDVLRSFGYEDIIAIVTWKGQSYGPFDVNHIPSSF